MYSTGVEGFVAGEQAARESIRYAQGTTRINAMQDPFFAHKFCVAAFWTSSGNRERDDALQCRTNLIAEPALLESFGELEACGPEAH